MKTSQTAVNIDPEKSKQLQLNEANTENKNLLK